MTKKPNDVEIARKIAQERANEIKKMIEATQEAVAAIEFTFAFKKVLKCVEEGGDLNECMRKVYSLPEYREFSPQPDYTNRLFDPKKAMIFSSYMEKAFNEAGIKLGDDETFACLICVTTKTPQIQRPPRFDYIKRLEI